MSKMKVPYPPSPVDVPEDLTQPTGNYTLQVVALLMSLLAFIAVYIGLIALNIYLFNLSIRYDNILGIIICPIITLFLVKGFFSRERPDKTLHIEIEEAEHPTLFAFIHKLCDETGAPLPSKVYVSPDVNAAMMQELSLLNLVFPARRNLLIGLGLVNSLNLSEFKAVMAHEFGHFSQKSLALNQYVYVASRIVRQLVYGRDWFDNILSKIGMLDLRLALFTWTIQGIMWVIRKTLAGLFYVITLGRLAMSRQMEFNADLVAVSVTGSDAIVHALSRLDFANESLDQVFNDLKDAADHQLYTADMFHHHTHAAEYLRRVRNKPTLGMPPPLPKSGDGRKQRIFTEGDETGIPAMWASHPANYLREENAKELYIPGKIDDRSPWILFSNVDELRERMTRKVYRLVFNVPKNTELVDPERVQTFIDDERSETTYDPKYHGAYDGRPIRPGDLAGIVDQVGEEPWETDRLQRVYEKLYRELEERMPEYNKTREEYHLLKAYLDDKKAPSEIPFRKGTIDRHEAKKLVKKLEKSLDDQIDWLASFDRRVVLVHCQLAYRLSEQALRDLINRYRFQLRIQELHTDCAGLIEHVNSHLALLGSGGNLPAEQFEQITSVLREARNWLRTKSKECREIRIPRLKNFEAGTILGDFLFPEPVLSDLDGASITGKWIDKLFKQLNGFRSRSARIHFKNLGTILKMQDEYADRWLKGENAEAIIPDVIFEEESEPLTVQLVDDDYEVPQAESEPDLPPKPSKESKSPPKPLGFILLEDDSPPRPTPPKKKSE
ncbi:M48 family metallopeptidase [Tuwongella immobilis]|uniref:Peptidase M48 domain-containing protein n=1 Tax=Tuwongella immobilis TaxID=692036 RepID=A0A6C2YLL9_9BACT|nr:M48 family metallopeptidase [Tuwongella immobilis]VIP02468.1 m48 family : Peptidase M48, Ste24p OS=Saccharophagus degradans (strain 2-40 / ATCC 43961 / DSM 17024) GN=Sde_3604 PE=4 SV=1: Peptidase_M48 [Tuwongella immobilis]VTS01490.1 m48 family : Peptidase M48, Ste24p OS=Saccharophagus degradans (strain 2-40 / ATCC 43961 / DSM 17024) GN=Sde_3604 PE=4 SV=1: Peptidase_M48 [Tuwongella immobilis]